EEAGYTAEEMAGKPIDGELVATVTAVATPTAPTRASDPEATPEPEPEATPVAANEADIDAATRTQIESLVTRATKSHAWASAHDYFITRFEGGILQFALERLVQAEREAEPQAA
ncbi:hypothetical protein CCR95_17370, partial [Thiocystis minor]|nr:hypothetical protein [Thiocystis minor]